VTHGTAGKTILSHDTLNQITNQVNLMSKAKQDGEIKIRLKPDHLGELMMSVKTNGQQVSLQIKAQDHESKRIIEESLGRLKDSLATQSLDLGKVDVVTQSTQSQGSDFGLQMDLGQQGRGFQQGSSQSQGSDFGLQMDLGQQGRGFQQGSSGQETASFGGGRQEFLYHETPVSGNLKTINVAARSGRASGPGSLDLIA
jgi:flagellar hook-length control protein FliK